MRAADDQGTGPALTHLPVLSSVATGTTSLSAFHRALVQVGLGYLNLVRLSSIVPPGVTVGASDAPVELSGSWGDRLYCVYAEQRASTPGEAAWAGVGWVQRLDGGGGMLVEHEGASESSVREQIRGSLTDMAAETGTPCSAPELVVTGLRCVDRPVAALVVVPFVSVPWSRSES